MATNPITQREEWLEIRRRYLGGSDIGSVMSLGDYACALKVFNDKTGAVKTNAFFGNSATERGNEMEEFIAHKYGQITGRQVRKSTPKAHRLYPRLRPQSDYEIVNTSGLTVQFPKQEPLVLDDSWKAGVLSIKCPGLNMFKKFQYEGVSAEYILQLQYELACWNRRFGAFGIFNAELWKMLHFDIQYDPEIGEAAVAAANRFLEEHIDKNVAPEKLDSGSKACRRCEYFVGCHHDQLLHEASEEDGLSFPFIGDAELSRKILKVQEARELKREAEQLEAEAIAEVKPLIEQYPALECANPQDETMKLRIYFREQKGKESFKWSDAKKAFSKDADLMAKLNKFVSQSKPSRPLKIFDIPIR